MLAAWYLLALFLAAAPAALAAEASEQALEYELDEGSWEPEPEPMVGWNCTNVLGNTDCQKVYGGGYPAAYPDEAICGEYCKVGPTPTPGPPPPPHHVTPKEILTHPKDHPKEVAIAVVATLVVLAAAGVGVAKCRKCKSDPLTESLDAGIQQDEHAVSSW